MRVALIAFSAMIVFCGGAQAETIVKKRITVEETIQRRGSSDPDSTGTIIRPSRPAALDPSDECDQLYLRRNAIFRRLGLCFTRVTAVSTFGNAGCQYDRAIDMPMSERDRMLVKRIVARERYLGCGRKP
jgi:hypothetical protein